MWPLILGGLGVAAFIAVAMSNNKTTRPQSGETWHYVFSVYPQLSLEQAMELEQTYRLSMANVATVYTVDAHSNPNTIDVVLHYNTKPTNDFPVGTELNLGPYTLVLAEKNKQ